MPPPHGVAPFTPPWAPEVSESDTADSEALPDFPDAAPDAGATSPPPDDADALDAGRMVDV